MPYFHDIELHFFKRCGKATSSVKRGYWKKTSWKKILYYAIGGATGLIVLFALYKYRQGESGEEGFPFVSKIQDWFSSLRSQRQGYNGPAEEELPDFDDKPVSSKYGTL